MGSSELSNSDILRFSRQLIIPEFGVRGQLALRHSSALIVGCGGLGCPAAIFLAAAGVGTIGKFPKMVRLILHHYSLYSGTDSTANEQIAFNSRLICRICRIIGLRCC